LLILRDGFVLKGTSFEKDERNRNLEINSEPSSNYLQLIAIRKSCEIHWFFQYYQIVALVEYFIDAQRILYVDTSIPSSWLILHSSIWVEQLAFDHPCTRFCGEPALPTPCLSSAAPGILNTFFGAIGCEFAITAHEILTGWLVTVVANLEMG